MSAAVRLPIATRHRFLDALGDTPYDKIETRFDIAAETAGRALAGRPVSRAITRIILEVIEAHERKASAA